MKRILFIFTVLFFVCYVPGSLAEEKTPDKASEPEIFTQLKKLQGTWRGKKESSHEKTEEEVEIRYQVTSGGSALVETFFPGTEQEMLSVYHPDGDTVVMTHYCMLGNQPRMKVSKHDDKQISFDFQDGTNLKSDKEPYMRSLKISFIDENTIKQTWSMHAEGKKKEEAVFTLNRQP